MMRLNKIYFLQLVLFFYASNIHAQIDTISIKFASSEAGVTLKHKRIIDATFEGLSNDLTYNISILGWTDCKGSAEMNKLLSERRATNVHNYILESFDIDRFSTIEYSGNGELQLNVSAEEKRQVMIILSRNVNKKIENKDILDNVAIGESMVLKNLIFEPGKPYLIRKSVPYLFELFETLIKRPTLKIQIEGHVWGFYVGDSLEEKEKAQILSEGRAKNIYNFLVRKGISKERLSYIGFGVEQPLPLTTKDPSHNRRVEIRVMEK